LRIGKNEAGIVAIIRRVVEGSLREDLSIVARAEQVATEAKLMRAGADRVICPQVIGGMRMSNIITRPHVVDFADADAAGVELEMDEHRVTADSPLRDKTLMEAKLPSRAEVMVVAIRHKDGSAVYNPGPNERVVQDDTLIMIGRAGASKRLEELNLT
jgi:voltage-gated potassium channel